MLHQIRKRRFLPQGDATNPSQLLALVKEVFQIYKSCLRHSTVETGKKLLKVVFRDSGLESPMSEQRLYDFLGMVLIDLFDELGPVYGKVLQAFLTSTSSENLAFAQKLQLARLYTDWPPLSFDEVQAYLDEHVPEWHQDFVIEPHPLGVSAVAQIHTAIDETGKEWAIKILKPGSVNRLQESLRAIDQLVKVLRPLEHSKSGRGVVKEIKNLIAALKSDVQLKEEAQRIREFHSDKLRVKRVEKLLSFPDIYPKYCNEAVLTIEKPQGHSLAEVLGGLVALEEVYRKVFAKKNFMVQLVELFAEELFHPHPEQSNLILDQTGRIAIFDWGLTGELAHEDRLHGSQLLLALLGGDAERAVTACFHIARDHEVMLEKPAIAAAFASSGLFIENKNKGIFHERVRFVFEKAEELHIPIPEGLLLMARSLLTLSALVDKVDLEHYLDVTAQTCLLTQSRSGLDSIREAHERFSELTRQILHTDKAQ